MLPITNFVAQTQYPESHAVLKKGFQERNPTLMNNLHA